MNFQPELAAKVMAGEKTVTRRLVSDNPRSPWSVIDCRLRATQTYAVCPGRGKHAIGRVYVTDVHKQRIGDVFGEALGDSGDDAEAHREGFENAVAFKLAWLKINGGYDPDARVWRVEFEVSPMGRVSEIKAPSARTFVPQNPPATGKIPATLSGPGDAQTSRGQGQEETTP